MMFNKLIVLASAAFTFFGASAYGFEENYRSAGVVPLFETYAFRRYGDDVAALEKTCLLYVKHSHEGVSLLTDKSKKRKGQDIDSAVTAARAFFKHQRTYETVGELAQALRTSATKIHMGDHITYFLEFNVNDLADLMSINNVWKNACVPTLVLHDHKVVLMYREDLKKAMNHGWQKRCDRGSAKNVQARDAFGKLRTIMDKFLIGLTNNYSKIKYLFA